MHLISRAEDELVLTVWPALMTRTAQWRRGHIWQCTHMLQADLLMPCLCPR